jgi:hypothetical protein
LVVFRTKSDYDAPTAKPPTSPHENMASPRRFQIFLYPQPFPTKVKQEQKTQRDINRKGKLQTVVEQDMSTMQLVTKS